MAGCNWSSNAERSSVAVEAAAETAAETVAEAVVGPVSVPSGYTGSKHM